MKKIHLVMPMGGAGSRFYNHGYNMPKPLIKINGKPFLFWSTQSIAKFVDLIDITFVVLKQHVEQFHIDSVIKEYYPKANIVVLDHVLNGAVLTCIEGVKNIKDNYPIIFNDCDHLFLCQSLYEFCNNEKLNLFDGALLSFKSNDPKYSYLKEDFVSNVIETAEKKVISDKAICGTYLFNNKDIFLKNAQEYLKECNYSEYFMSGVYNTMIKNKYTVKYFNVETHLDFGTPEEYENAKSNKSFMELL